MFKTKSFLEKLLALESCREAFQRTYRCEIDAVERSVPKGYEIRGMYFMPDQGSLYWLAGEHSVMPFATMGNIPKGTLYLDAGRMIQETYEDRELAPGYCCIVLRPTPKSNIKHVWVKPELDDLVLRTPPALKPSPAVSNLDIVWSSSDIKVGWRSIYPVQASDIARVADSFGVQLVKFRFVEVGEKYLQHDLKSVQTWTARRAENQLRFMRWVVK